MAVQDGPRESGGEKKNVINFETIFVRMKTYYIRLLLYAVRDCPCVVLYTNCCTVPTYIVHTAAGSYIYHTAKTHARTYTYANIITIYCIVPYAWLR